MADVRAVASGHGELDGEFEQRLDALLTELSQGWRAPELAEPHRSSETFRDYHRRNAKRMQVANVLAQRPDTARRSPARCWTRSSAMRTCRPTGS